MIETGLVELIDRATVECVEQRRTDLHHRLRQIRNRVLDPTQLVLVVGESKQGKSELVNAIVNAPVCESGANASTVVPTLVRYSDEPSALLLEQRAAHGPAALDRNPVPVEQIREQLAQALNAGRPIARGEVGLPRAVLKKGLAVMDTPGVGSVTFSLTATTLAAVAEADALLMVSDATQELTTNELNFLKQATALCPNIALVQPKIDVTPHWRRIVEVNRKHLANAGINGTIFPVSSLVRRRAASTRDPELNAESGFPPLIEYLHGDVSNQHEKLTRRLVAHNAGDALDQIIESLRDELSGQNPRNTTETLLEMEAAQRRTDELRRITSRWQKVLNDGVQELYADIEFDLRERTMAVLHRAQDALDDNDPNVVWEPFSEWLRAALADAAAETFAWLNQRCEQLADQVCEHFLREHADTLPHLTEFSPPRLRERLTDPRTPRSPSYKRRDQVLTGLRGSYAGVLMFGLITGMVGLPLMNVVSISAGLLLGSKSLNEEKTSRLKRRQGEARQNMQRYVDSATFHLNKEAKDAVRCTHRLLHEHFTTITEQAQTQLSESIQQIKRSAERSAVDRERRTREIRKKIEELTTLRKRVTMLTSNRIAAA